MPWPSDPGTKAKWSCPFWVVETNGCEFPERQQRTHYGRRGLEYMAFLEHCDRRTLVATPWPADPAKRSTGLARFASLERSAVNAPARQPRTHYGSRCLQDGAALEHMEERMYESGARRRVDGKRAKLGWRTLLSAKERL